jgi:membrane protein required for colicin V production
MNLLDYVLIVILGYCLVRGAFRGLIKELSAIVGVLGGFYAAYSYYSRAAHYLAHWVANPGYLKIISFFIVFVMVFWVVSLVGVILKYLMNIAYLGWTDRISGAVFGALKGLLIAIVLILVLTTFLPQNAKIIKNSWGAHNLMQFSAYLVKVTPKEMKESFEVKMKELNKSWQRR